MSRDPKSKKSAGSDNPPSGGAPGGLEKQIAAVLSAPVGKPSSLVDTRVIHCGDCLEQLKNLPNGCINLIYIDPPFNSNRNYEVFWGETKEKRAFDDRHASTQAYIDYMRPRCVELARVLKPTGSFYYHCDWHACHYVKVMLDQIFGESKFQNEIVWKRQSAHNDAKQGSKHYGRTHDTIFFYTGGAESYTFNHQYTAYDDEYLSTFYSNVEEGTGRRFQYGDLTAPGGANPEKGNPHYEFLGVTRYWRYSEERMKELHAQGRIDFRPNGKVPRLKRYLDEAKGMAVGSVWNDIRPLINFGNEALGYPTQKPVALLERIIKTSSNPNDIILDAFCGCGTALVASQNLGRQWIGIDVSPTACRVMAKRLQDVCNLPENEKLWRVGRGFVMRSLPWTAVKLKALPAFEFENWAVIALGGIPNKVQVGDMGVDGRIYPVGTKPSDIGSKKIKGGHTGEHMFADDWFPIQVKQSDKVGRPDIDAFEAVMEREGPGGTGRQRGFFVAFGYSSDAERECAAFHKRTGRIIKLLTVQEILDEEYVQKM